MSEHLTFTGTFRPLHPHGDVCRQTAGSDWYAILTHPELDMPVTIPADVFEQHRDLIAVGATVTVTGRDAGETLHVATMWAADRSDGGR